ncbi:hypothetical protein BJ875DRAFT_545975 [Amylocarpus encephaloides]|uniref:Uncharacterized protein n=1 Tax=Amylocarpus encephaloides TaxID=45428 RepID=A0A9P7YB63_9HELO|nr:hypothetical protein BJ875DRAFT_545975 [Amylocarpus encephaloides]
MGNKPSLSAFLINDAVLPTTENFATTSNRVKFTIGPIPHCVSFYTDRLPTFSASPIFQDSQLILSQEHPSTFRLFAQWLSSGCIVTPSQSSVEKMVTYARAWVFGERYSVKGFQNAIAVELNEMIKVSSWEELRGLLGFLWDPFEGEPEGDTTILERIRRRRRAMVAMRGGKMTFLFESEGWKTKVIYEISGTSNRPLYCRVDWIELLGSENYGVPVSNPHIRTPPRYNFDLKKLQDQPRH